MKKIVTIAAILLMLGSLIFTGCVSAGAASVSGSNTQDTTSAATYESTKETMDNTLSGETANILTSFEGSMLDVTEMFTERDLEQTANLDEAVYMELSSNEDVIISEEGVYVLSGDVKNVTIEIDAEDEKIHIVLDGVSIVNDDAPAIYVKSAGKVFITTTDSANFMEVTGTYTPDGETNLDAVIFSKEDVVLNGTGTLEIISSEGNGITSKDDLKITGGTYIITAAEDGIEANDSIRISGGDITVDAGKDALHSENEEDMAVGYIYISGGSLDITAGDDGIHGTTVMQIDGGTINIDNCMEGLEATSIQINGGEITIYAKDDGINASRKSSNFDLVIEINGGILDVTVGSGDTDAIDSNGDIYVNDGSINISANSAFDPDGTAQLNGGTVYVNGQQITEITEMMGGMGGMGGKGGMRPGGGRP